MTRQERFERVREVYTIACDASRDRGLHGDSLIDLAAFIVVAVADELHRDQDFVLGWIGHQAQEYAPASEGEAS